MNDQAATLRLAVVPRSGLLVDALLALGGAAFVGLAAQVSFHLGFTPVPITGQTFAVLLVGAAYGSVLGASRIGGRSASGACRLSEDLCFRPSTGSGGSSRVVRHPA